MNTTKFDVADYLDNKEMIAEYINTVLGEGNQDDLIVAIGNVAKVMGITKNAERSGLSRPSLYKALAEGSKPRFETMLKILQPIGGQIRIQPG